MSLKLSEVIPALDESAVEDFVSWRKSFQFVLSNMKETLGWSVASGTSFNRDQNVFRLENVFLKKLVKIKSASVAIGMVDDNGDKYSLLLTWFSSSVYGQKLKQKAESFSQGQLPILDYFSAKKEKLEMSYSSESSGSKKQPDTKELSQIIVSSILDGLNPSSRDPSVTGLSIQLRIS